mmetsp:Transcript_1753/g.2664  ORF Transcript_1753/g.2664 Transcript_1753/m.2664 type:complete len:179 (+) Transcript_1753:501-1037(+)
MRDDGPRNYVCDRNHATVKKICVETMDGYPIRDINGNHRYRTLSYTILERRKHNMALPIATKHSRVSSSKMFGIVAWLYILVKIRYNVGGRSIGCKIIGCGISHLTARFWKRKRVVFFIFFLSVPRWRGPKAFEIAEWVFCMGFFSVFAAVTMLVRSCLCVGLYVQQRECDELKSCIS